MLNRASVIAALRREIAKTLDVIKDVKLRRGHWLLDHTVVRLLWAVIPSADAILVLAESGRHLGVQPLLRNIFRRLSR